MLSRQLNRFSRACLLLHGCSGRNSPVPANGSYMPVETFVTGSHFRFYNARRSRQALEYRTRDELYFNDLAASTPMAA